MELKGGNLVGVVVMQVREQWDNTLTMKGWWAGYTSENEDGTAVTTIGETKWTKLD